MKTIILPLLMLSILITISCDPEPSEDVNQDRIKTNYFITYTDQSQETETAASFWFGSTPLKLRTPASVTANDQSMKQREIFGIVDYFRTFGSYLAQVTFEYIDHDGRTFVNVASLPASIQLSDTLTGFSRSQDLLIQWIGDEIGADESITLELINGDAYYATTKNNLGGTSILLGANELSVEFLGQTKMKMSRSKESDLQEAPRGGKITGTFTSKIIYVEISQ